MRENQTFDKSLQKDQMALKSADDKSKRLVLLEELQRSPALDAKGLAPAGRRRQRQERARMRKQAV